MKFKVGDIIEVVSLEGITYIGKALQSRYLAGGPAYFSILTTTGEVRDFNLNIDEAEVIYSDPLTREMIEDLMERR